MPGTRKLGKTTDQRMAMLRQQVTDFLDNGRMETTITRAKEIKPLAEKMIAWVPHVYHAFLSSTRSAATSSLVMWRTSCSRRSLLSMQSATAAIPASSAPASAAVMLPRPPSSSWSSKHKFIKKSLAEFAVRKLRASCRKNPKDLLTVTKKPFAMMSTS